MNVKKVILDKCLLIITLKNYLLESELKIFNNSSPIDYYGFQITEATRKLQAEFSPDA